MSWITREYTNSFSLLDQIIITFFLITAFASSIIFDITKVIILIFITLLFFSFQEKLLRKWLTALINTIPLFISLLIFNILFDNGYFNTIHLILKICYIILLSVFLINLISFNNLEGNLIKKGKAGKIKLFLISTLQYINILYNFYTDSKIKDKGLLHIIREAFSQKNKNINLADIGDLTHEQFNGQLKGIILKPFFLLFLSILIIFLNGVEM